MDQKQPLEWKPVNSQPAHDLILFQSYFRWYQNPRNHHILKAVVLEAPDWVNVVALTPEDKVIVVEQYRFGVEKTTLEIPAGIIEPNETPQAAARRELLEETGYAGEEWKSLGYVEPNPAYLNNRCYHFLLQGAVRTREPNPDQGEHIRVLTLDQSSLRQMIDQGRMRHALALTAISRVSSVWRKP